MDELEKGDEQEEGGQDPAGMAGKGGQDEEGEKIEAPGVKQDVRPVGAEVEPGGEPLEFQGSGCGLQPLPAEEEQGGEDEEEAEHF